MTDYLALGDYAVVGQTRPSIGGFEWRVVLFNGGYMVASDPICTGGELTEEAAVAAARSAVEDVTPRLHEVLNGWTTVDARVFDRGFDGNYHPTRPPPVAKLPTVSRPRYPIPGEEPRG